MAKSIESQTLNTSHLQERTYPEVWKLRLALGWTILFGALVGLFSLSWDIQWHTAVGRDRTLTPPHLFILGSVALMGLAAVTAVLIETLWARRSASIAQSGTPFAGFFSGSLGAYLVGYGALDTAIAFPIDQYWHTLYGVDVAIWAPFHIMLLTGFCVCCLGVAYMLVDGMHLAAQRGAKGAARAAYAGVLVAFATLLGMLSILLPSALGDAGYLSIGGLTFTVYPLMLGAMGTPVLVAAIRALPGRWAATRVIGVYMLFGVISFVLIPPLMTLLLGIEQQSLLPRAPTVSVLSLSWQYPLLIAAVLLDVVTRVMQNRGWSLRKSNTATFVTASIGISLATLFYPLFIRSQFLATAQLYALGGGAAAKAFRSGASSGGLSITAIVIVVVSLLLGLLGTYVGYRFGAGIGASMQPKEQ